MPVRSIGEGPYPSVSEPSCLNRSLSDSCVAASVSWGDHTTSGGTVQANGSGWKVLAAHEYADWGTYPVSVTPADSGGASANVLDTITVTWPEGEELHASVDVPPPAGATPAHGFAATIDWGDGQTSDGTATAVPNSAGNGLASVTVSGSHAYAEEGVYTITATVTDTNTGATSSATKQPTIADVQLTSEGANFLAGAGAATTAIVAYLTDDNALSTGADLSVSINWGDGTAASAGTLLNQGQGEFEVQGTHTYASTGSYTVTTTLDDDISTQGHPTTTATGAATVEPAWGLVQSDVLTPADNDPERALLVSVGEATVDLNTGGLRLAHPLDFDLSPGTGVGGSPALVYDSRTVNVRPVVQAELDAPSSGTTPSSITATLTWNGTAGSQQTFSTAGLRSAGAEFA